MDVLATLGQAWLLESRRIKLINNLSSFEHTLKYIQSLRIAYIAKVTKPKRDPLGDNPHTITSAGTQNLLLHFLDRMYSHYVLRVVPAELVDRDFGL